MKKFILSVVFAMMTISSAQAGVLQIVAIVNDEIITSYDFYNRVNMAVVNTGLPRNQETFAKLAPIVIRELVQESLKIQTANNVGLDVSVDDLDASIATIARNNKMSPEEFSATLTKSGVEIDTLRDQIEANILWREYVVKRILPRVDVPEEEVVEFMQKLADNEGETEYLIEEIFYPVDNAEIELSAKEVLDELLVEIKANPDSFSELAAKFSKAPNNGQIGWVLPDALSPEIRTEVLKMDKDNVSPLIRTLQGFSLIKLLDKRVVDNNLNKITKEALARKLTMEKVEILAKRKLRDIKEIAFIEIKL